MLHDLVHTGHIFLVISLKHYLQMQGLFVLRIGYWQGFLYQGQLPTGPEGETQQINLISRSP